MRWIVIITLFAIGPVLDVLSWFLPTSLIDAVFLYGGVGAAGVVMFRLVRAWGMPTWIGLVGLALPWLYAAKGIASGVPLYALTPFLLFNTIATVLLTFGGWTAAMLEWGNKARDGGLLVQGFLFPALYALCAFPLAAYIDSFLPERRLMPLYHNASTGEYLLGFLKLWLNISGIATAVGAALALVFMVWLTFLRATGFRRNED